MHVIRHTVYWVLVATLGLICTSAVAQSAPPTAFTYQGQLQESGSPATTAKDFVFRLFDAAIGGTQVGADQPRTVTPAGGVFSVSLDFGATAWARNEGRWLEIEVDGIVLNPRERLEPTPFALNTRGITVDSSRNVGILNSAPSSVLHMGDFNYSADNWLTIATAGGNRFRAGMKLRHFADDLGWTLESDERFPGLYIQSLVSGIEETRLFVNPFTGFVGISTIDPIARLDVREASDDSTGVNVTHTGSGIVIGVDSEVDAGFGLRGTATDLVGTSYGVYGEAQGTNSWGVFSNGRLGATGTKSFAIDHPLNPKDWILLHYSSEAPEPLNTYSGTVVLDSNGQAVVGLPEYFDSININERYHLTPVGAPAPNLHIATEVADNQFTIAGGPPGIKVSWQVTATRNDRFVSRFGAPTEIQKSESQRGIYLSPVLFDD